MKHSTIKNKVSACILIAVGYSSVFIDGDVTIFIVSMIFGMGLFFAKRNVFE